MLCYGVIVYCTCERFRVLLCEEEMGVGREGRVGWMGYWGRKEYGTWIGFGSGMLMGGTGWYKCSSEIIV